MTVTILIADDEPNQLELLSFNLEQAGFAVMKAMHGQDALQKIEDHSPDLVILDWMMPHMSGIELCRALRSRADTKLLPVIILSARGEEGDRTLGLDTGADDYMSKPFSPRELVSRVKALLRRSRPALMSDTLEFEDLQLFPSRMEVHRAGQMVPLGPKEFRLLSILIERPGQVFSRAQLLDLVWGHGVYVEERTVDVHLSRLRKAINKPDGRAEMPNLIRTVRGSGYALRAPH
ncbi:MAG: response regulator [Alphaproteobacteria bacterium]|jgi:two-component system phosphate regulon response regulator PhoB|nr:response regulator [Alphaproteobacteria bacterium]